MFWPCSGFHLIFTYIPFKIQMFFTLWKPYVMFLLNSLALLLNYLSYSNVIYGISCLCSLSCFSYGDVIYGIVIVYLTTCTIVGTTNGSTMVPLQMALHHFLCPQIYVLLFPRHSWGSGSSFLNYVLPLENTSWKVYCNFFFVL
jgi:hypothetical protein